MCTFYGKLITRQVEGLAPETPPRVALRVPARDILDRWWPVGSEFEPQRCGFDNARGCYVSEMRAVR